MGRFESGVRAKFQHELDKVGDWGEDVQANLRGVGEGIGAQLESFEDMFIEMGEFAAELYEQAENEVGELKEQLLAAGDAVVKEIVWVGAEIGATVQKIEAWAERAIENIESVMNAVGYTLNKLGDDIHDSAAAQELRMLCMAFM